MKIKLIIFIFIYVLVSSKFILREITIINEKPFWISSRFDNFLSKCISNTESNLYISNTKSIEIVNFIQNHDLIMP